MSERILVVDDDPQVIKVLQRVLQHAGYHPVPAHSGKQALATLDQVSNGEQGPIDLILLDILMPGMDGMQVCQEIRQRPEWLSVPIIMLTALTSSQDRIAAFDAGANDYVTKPFQPQELVARVNASINMRRLQARQREAERQARQLAIRLVQAQEEERQRLARELHDEVGQMLTGIKLHLAVLDNTISSEQSQLHQLVAEGQALVKTTMEEVRRMVMDLRPTLLDDLGLIPALDSYLENFTERTGLLVQAQLTLGTARLPAAMETALYRIFQEALTNVVRHAAARQVQVTLKIVDSQLLASIEDDGRGFDPTARLRDAWREGHMGIVGIRERVTLFNGSLELTSAPGKGTQLTISLPLPSDPHQ